MGKVIRVTPEELEKVSKELEELSATYKDISKLLLDKASTMGTAWEGEDNLAFVSQINGFTEELKAMADKIFSASKTLHQQATNYSERQEDNIVQVKKLVN